MERYANEYLSLSERRRSYRHHHPACLPHCGCCTARRSNICKTIKRNKTATKEALSFFGGENANKIGSYMNKSLLAFAALFVAILPYTVQAQTFATADRAKFHDFIVKEHHPSFRFAQEARVGVVLPEAGVTFYDVPAEYHARPGYRYAIVNDHAVIVDSAHRIVEIIE
jgi:hypothetical protein